jgi:hypothetical protein
LQSNLTPADMFSVFIAQLGPPMVCSESPLCYLY